jgi:hypothetical protein
LFLESFFDALFFKFLLHLGIGFVHLDLDSLSEGSCEEFAADESADLADDVFESIGFFFTLSSE